MRKPKNVLIACAGISLALLLAACASKPEPVDIYPEDMCAYCRMAISDRAFAAEIITEEGEALKFDDIVCLASYREQAGAKKPAATFLADYHSRNWIEHEKAFIIQTRIQTPMGSGLVAFADSTASQEFLRQHLPAIEGSVK